MSSGHVNVMLCRSGDKSLLVVNSVPVAQWLEHCVSSAKGCGLDSQGTHVLTKKCIT